MMWLYMAKSTQPSGTLPSDKVTVSLFSSTCFTVTILLAISGRCKIPGMLHLSEEISKGALPGGLLSDEDEAGTNAAASARNDGGSSITF